jgi:hypothetical protein
MGFVEYQGMNMTRNLLQTAVTQFLLLVPMRETAKLPRFADLFTKDTLKKILEALRKDRTGPSAKEPLLIKDPSSTHLVCP